MLNAIWIGMVLVALFVGALEGKLDAVAKALASSASGAVTLALSLVGMMALFLGLMRVLQEGGLLRGVARALRPVMVRLFPEVPPEHPAMSMMIMNFTANMLGLANAATPFGLKAMSELDDLNPNKGTATNAMALFLAINTSNLALFPTGIIGLRTAAGSASPASIFLPTLIATAISTTVAVLATKAFITLSSRAPAGGPPVASSPAAAPRVAAALDAQVAEAMAAIQREPPPASRRRRLVTLALALALAAVFVLALQRRAQIDGWGPAARNAVSEWMLLLLVAAFVLYGVGRGVKVYDAVVEGGKEGFQVAVRIIPFLVAILVAVGMLRASGALDLIIHGLAPLTNLVGIPPETLPMVLLRPLSGSGAYGVAAEIMKTYGPDSLIGNVVTTMQGSSETTFYVLAVYYGAVQVKNTRFTLAPCLIAEATGMIASAWACRLLLF
jgi:spore maturation protein SpmA